MFVSEYAGGLNKLSTLHVLFFLLLNNPKSNHLPQDKTPPPLLTHALMEVVAGSLSDI